MRNLCDNNNSSFKRRSANTIMSNYMPYNFLVSSRFVIQSSTHPSIMTTPSVSISSHTCIHNKRLIPPA